MVPGTSGEALGDLGRFEDGADAFDWRVRYNLAGAKSRSTRLKDCSWCGGDGDGDGG